MATGFGDRLVLRRLAAFGIDYLLMAAYLLFLVVTSVLLLASPAGASYARLWSSPESGDLMGLGVLTGPVVLYFALSESLRGATVGKHVLGLRVARVGEGRLPLGRSFVRSAIKFLPWELAHFTIWHYVYAFSSGGQPPSWTTVTLGVVYTLVALYLLTMVFTRSHRTIYDLIAGSVIQSAKPDPPMK